MHDETEGRSVVSRDTAGLCTPVDTICRRLWRAGLLSALWLFTGSGCGFGTAVVVGGTAGSGGGSNTPSSVGSESLRVENAQNPAKATIHLLAVDAEIRGRVAARLTFDAERYAVEIKTSIHADRRRWYVVAHIHAGEIDVWHRSRLTW